MKIKLSLYLPILLTVIIAACDDDDEKSLNSTDKSFVENAALANMTEVDFARIASTKATDSLVKAFANHMIAEHTKAQEELEDIEDDYDNTNWPESLDEQHQQIRQQLNTLSGYSFDSLYMTSQVMDHEMAVTLFENEANGGTEARVKNYSAKYLPHIQQHLDEATTIKNSIDDDHMND